MIDQTNHKPTIVPIHLIRETWQCDHVWHIPLELEQVCCMWWCNFHCIFASIKPSPMKSNGQFSRSGHLLVHKFSSSKVVLDSSMKLSTKFVNLKTMLPIGHSSMGGRRHISRITWWLWIIVHYSFTWMLATQALFMMSPSCVNQMYTKIGANFLCIFMNNLNTY